MKCETRLHRLRTQLAPKRSQKARIKQQLMAQIAVPTELLALHTALQPPRTLKQRLWQRIQGLIGSPAVPLLERVRAMLTPAADVRLFVQQLVFRKLQPNPELTYGWVKWTAAVAVVAILVQLSPSFLLAPRTVAESKVILLPTAGEVAVSVAGLWEEVRPGQEVVLQPGMRVRTYDGEATVVFRDDAVVRLDGGTMLAIHDTSPRLDSAPEIVSTFTLAEGRVWLLGLVPATVRGMTVSTSYGHVTVNEGSASIASTADTVEVNVWDRRALVAYNGESKILSVGDKTEFRGDSIFLVKKVADAQFDEDWFKQNLARDAVHRRYIAHLQHERLVALAGILPTSTLYPAKRIAERVDVFLTFDEEARILKLLEQARTRRSEAAALLAQGESPDEVVSSLEEYRQNLLELASGSGGDMVTRFLIKQKLNEMSTEVAAAQPGDDAYVLKKVVLELASSLPEELVDSDEAQTTLLVDAFEVLVDTVNSGDLTAIEQTWQELQSYLAMVQQEDSPLDPIVRQEILALLGRFAETVDGQRDELVDVDPELIDDIVAFLPTEEATLARVRVLTDAEVAAVVDAMYERIYNYAMPRSRLNQLQVEIAAIKGHDEQGRFLRALYAKLPEGSRLTVMVRKEIVRLRWKKAGEVVQQQLTTEAAVEI